MKIVCQHCERPTDSKRVVVLGDRHICRKCTVVKTARCLIVRPVDGDWDALGRTLRALQTPAHRVLTNVARDLELARHDASNEKPLRSLCYDFVKKRWAEERDAARARCARKRGGYQGDEAVAEVLPSSALALGMDGVVYERWKRFDKDRWSGKSTLPTFRSKPSLCVAGQGVRLRARDGRYLLRVSLLPGHGTANTLAVRPYAGKDHGVLNRVLDGTATLGSIQIKRDGKDGPHKGKWMVLISCSEERVEPPAAGRTMAVHRGVSNFLTMAIAREGNRSARTRIVQTGDDIVRSYAIYDRRLRSMQKQKGQVGKGARGHGKKRREQHLKNLKGKQANRIASKCEQVAADLMRHAQRDGVSRILIEDWANPASEGDSAPLGRHVAAIVRRFPMGRLRDCIERAAELRGIRVERVSTYYNSCRCPKCEHVHETPPLHRDGRQKLTVFQCHECDLKRPVDVVFAWNMLVRDGQELPLDDAIAAEKRAVEAIRAAMEAAE